MKDNRRPQKNAGPVSGETKAKKDAVKSLHCRSACLPAAGPASTQLKDWATPHTLLMVNFSDALRLVIKKSGQPPTHAAFEGVEATLRATCVRLGNN